MRSLNSLIWRNLSAHGLRSILTILAIMLGVAMVLAASIVGQAASKSAAQLSQQRPVADLHLFSRGDTPLQETTLDTLRSFPGIDRLSPSLRVQAALVPDAVGLSQGEIPKHIPLSLIGVEPRVFADLHRPRLADGAFLDRPDTIVMPMQITTQYGWHIGDQVMLIAPEDKQETLPTGQTMTLTISGRIEFKQSITALADETVAYIPLPVAQRLAGLLGQIDQVDIVLDSGLDVNRIKTKLEKQLGSEIVLARAIAGEGVMGNVLLVQAGLAIVGLIILFAAGFVILNAFAMSITGRRQEIGALRALGMTRRQILITVLIEAGLLGSVGTATGLLIGLGLARGVMLIMGTLQDIPFDAPWWGVTVSALMGLAVTMIAALQPARQASRISPITAIRSEATASAGWYVRAGGRAGIWLSTFLLIGLIAYGLLGRPNIATALPVMVIGQATLLGAAVLLLPALIAPLT
ncbi:MAG: ABC transporter permease, partial [Anaerolineae bacterium]|nr:ABC transporter permease [Anaerolineae bacterium]